MDNKSPFGEVSGICIQGTTQKESKTVVLHVALETDDAINMLPMHVWDRSQQTAITWDGVGTITYTALLLGGGGGRVNVALTYVHSVALNTLAMSIVAFFEPHGWVRFEDAVLALDRHSIISVSIPMDIVEERMERKRDRGPMADLEAIYGMSLDDEGGPNSNNKKRSYTQLPWMNGRKRRAPNLVHDNSGQVPRMIPLDEYSTFMEQKAKRELEEARIIKDELMPVWHDSVRAFVMGMFRNVERVRQIIRQWHVRPIFARDNVCELLAAFMNAVLTSPVQLKITDTHLHVFLEPALGIPVTWLTTDERISLHKLVVNRATLFRRATTGIGSQYMLSDFRLDAVLVEAICPRFIVHQFVVDCVECALATGRERPTLLLTVISAVGLCWRRNKRDPFLCRLLSALQRRTVIHDVRQVGLFVKIGDEMPEYMYDKSSVRTRRPVWAPATPVVAVAASSSGHPEKKK